MAVAFILLQLTWRLPDPIWLIGLGSSVVIGLRAAVRQQDQPGRRSRA